MFQKFGVGHLSINTKHKTKQNIRIFKTKHSIGYAAVSSCFVERKKTKKQQWKKIFALLVAILKTYLAIPSLPFLSNNWHLLSSRLYFWAPDVFQDDVSFSATFQLLDLFDTVIKYKRSCFWCPTVDCSIKSFEYKLDKSSFIW